MSVPFVLIHKFPECPSVAVAPVEQLVHCAYIVDFLLLIFTHRVFHAKDVAASDAVIGPLVIQVAVNAHRCYLHPVRMNLQEVLRLPFYGNVTASLVLALECLFVCPFPCAECLFDGLVSKVALSCGSQ